MRSRASCLELELGLTVAFSLPLSDLASGSGGSFGRDWRGLVLLAQRRQVSTRQGIATSGDNRRCGLRLALS